MKLTIKLSHLKIWDGNYLLQSPLSSSKWGETTFQIQNSEKECNFWVIHEGISEMETANCPKENCILIIGEEKSKKQYDPEYLAQFGALISTRTDLQHPRILSWHYICPWHLHKSYDQLKALQSLPKGRTLSTICSDEAGLEGHKKRFAFTNKMIGHFKDRLDVFGKGFNYIPDKYDGLAPYRYSIAIENSVHTDYWTEKLTDCYLSLTMPIYYGCPNVTDYFPAESLIRIDLDDYAGSIRIIEEAIESDRYTQNLGSLLKARDLVLDNYQIFPALLSCLSKNQNLFSPQSKGSTLIKPERFFQKGFTQARIKNKLNRIFKKRS